jgi:hypothetical protein
MVLLPDAAGCCFDDVRQRPELRRALEYLARETSRAVYVNRFRKALDEPSPVTRFQAANETPTEPWPGVLGCLDSTAP